MNDETRHEGGEKAVLAASIAASLRHAAALRRAAALEPRIGAVRDLLRSWQAARLAASYPDLLADGRYAPAAGFFLNDLYGPKDFSERDREVERILPLLVKGLPTSGLQTLALAVELDALSEDLDAALTAAMMRRKTRTLDDARYAALYREVGRRADRLRQIQLIRETGEALERLARKPLVASALRLMHGPAHLAGLGELHDFLERGFFAFRHMGSAADFLERIDTEERRLMRLWLGA